MEDKTMIIVLVAYLRENGLKRVVCRVSSPAKLDAYITQIEKMLSFCPEASEILQVL